MFFKFCTVHAPVLLIETKRKTKLSNEKPSIGISIKTKQINPQEGEEILTRLLSRAWMLKLAGFILSHICGFPGTTCRYERNKTISKV